MSKRRTAVLRGGPSSEYDISIMTGQSVLKALRQSEQFEPIDIVVTKDGKWLLNGISKEPRIILEMVDVVFLAFHGEYGEDGTVQRLLERYQVPYTGSKPFASALAFNKLKTKETLKKLGIKMAPHLVVGSNSGPDYSRIALSFADEYGLGFVIKPISSGSSVGTVVGEGVASLTRSLEESLCTYDQVLLEKRIIGAEATCGVINRFRDQSTYALPPIEIVPPSNSNFFDRTVKYDGSTQEICPGNFSREQKKELEEISIRVHKELGLDQYSRSDFMVGEDGIYFLEVNTLPGMTEESLLPKALAAVGCTYSQFVEHLLTDTILESRR